MKKLFKSLRVFAYNVDRRHGKALGLRCPYNDDLIAYTSAVSKDDLFTAATIYHDLKRAGVNRGVLNEMLNVRDEHIRRQRIRFLDYLMNSSHKELYDNFSVWFPKARLMLLEINSYVDLRKELGVSENLYGAWCKGKGAPPAVKKLAAKIVDVINYSDW